MFEFYKFISGKPGDLYFETRLPVVTSYDLFKGAALTIRGGSALVFATSAEKIYAICDISAASAFVTANHAENYRPRVIPVNANQIWKTSVYTAVTAGLLIGTSGFCGSALDSRGTAIDGGLNSGAGMSIWGIVTTPFSAVYVVFPNYA